MVFSLLLTGCITSHSDSGKGPIVIDPREETRVFGLGPEDIEKTAQFITESLTRLPEFADSTLQPWIILEPPDLNTRDRQLAADAPIFTDRLTTYLMKAQARRAKFISREDVVRLEKERFKIVDGTVTGGSDDAKVRDYRSADFFLLSKISDLTRMTTDGRAVTYLLCSFRLVNRRTSELAWKDDYQVTKRAKADASYR